MTESIDDQMKRAHEVKAQYDPTGKAAHEAGAKLDAGKPRWGLVIGGFGRALELVVAVGTFGANKYSDNGWKHVDNSINRYEDAMFRHWAAWRRGEWLDPESGLPHLGHMCWNALAICCFAIWEREDSKNG